LIFFLLHGYAIISTIGLTLDCHEEDLPMWAAVLRYETKLERQQHRAMSQLERVQRMRRGEDVPPLMTMEVSERP
jgi:hypothetical protein